MKILRDIDAKNKRVLVRVDFNVSLNKQGKALDDFRLRATMPTISYLLGQNAKVILMAHLGRPTAANKQEFTLAPVAQKLGELMGEKVELAEDCVGTAVHERVVKMRGGDILMLENLRWHKEEELNDVAFAQGLAELGEFYVNDAFAVSHRAHASVEAITRFLPSCAGLLLAKELAMLTRVRDNADHPFCVVIGGSKISSKLKLIQSFLGKAEDIILGGALANTMLHAKGIAIGKSVVDESVVEEVKNLEITNTKIHLPVDAVLCTNKEDAGLCRTGPVGKVNDDELLLDIGPDSEQLFARVIAQAKMVVWNGPVGLFENPAFVHGTQALAEAIAKSDAFSVIGGGETIAFLEARNLIDKFSFVSTGGGAMLEFFSGEELPGIVALTK